MSNVAGKNKFGRRLIGKAKVGLKSALLKLLVKLDDSVAYNLSAAAPPPQVETTTADSINTIKENDEADAEVHRIDTQPRPTIVLNEKGTIVNLEMLAIYFRAIFSSGDHPNAQRRAWEHLAKDPSRWTDYNTLTSTLKRFFSKQTGRTEEDSEATDLLEQIERHDRETGENRQAYLTDDKSNKNAVYWPNPMQAEGARSLFDEYPFTRSLDLIDKQTPIGSAGSCFAMEIAHRLQSDGFNYRITEPAPNENGLSMACAKWGIIFNAPSFRQLAEKAFGVRRLPKILWTRKTAGKTSFLDPFREDIIFDSIEQYEDSYESHIAAARKALTETKVFILTLGVNEVWKIKGEDVVFSRSPWRIAAGVVQRKVLTVEENVRELQGMLDLWRQHNGDVQLIISVSPVPVHATFRGRDWHVVAANAHSKATLRLAAEEFCKRNRGVHYFPSYESVMYCTRDAWQADQRHVSRAAVAKVMELFGKMFLKPSCSQ